MWKRRRRSNKTKEEEKFETHVETPVARQESLPSRIYSQNRGHRRARRPGAAGDTDVADTPEHARQHAQGLQS